MAGRVEWFAHRRPVCDEGSEPRAIARIIQSWEAVAHLNSVLVQEDINASLHGCSEAVNTALSNYDEVKQIIPRLDIDQTMNICPLHQGIALFWELTELG